MSFKNKHIVFATGSLKGIAIQDENINIKTYFYVRIVKKNQYLRISNDNYEFTDLHNATSFSQQEATKYVNCFRKHGINADLFSDSKNSF